MVISLNDGWGLWMGYPESREKQRDEDRKIIKTFPIENGKVKITTHSSFLVSKYKMNSVILNVWVCFLFVRNVIHKRDQELRSVFIPRKVYGYIVNPLYRAGQFLPIERLISCYLIIITVIKCNSFRWLALALRAVLSEGWRRRRCWSVVSRRK